MLGKELKEQLFNNKQNGWNGLNEEEKAKIFSFCDEYIRFLNKSKTERESVRSVKELAIERGYRNIEEMDSINPGDKVYFVNRDKNIFLAVIGRQKLENGTNIVGSHIDSPRIDLKPNPLYEDSEFGYFDTHYYGGIKQYQWTTIPLAIHGIIVKTNGEKIEINIGENEEDPIFVITDLLPHLAKDQMQKKLTEAILGEDLNLLIGSMPYESEDKDVSERIKLNILNIFNQRYGITEADFISSELELVPAFKAKSLGFDRGMVAGYGQDDRVCAYTSARAILDIESPEKTAICMLADKEEIGSMGNTGMEANTFEVFLSKLLDLEGDNRPNLIEKVFYNSKMLSADVDAGFDPIYPAVVEKNNTAYLGYGVGLNKYTGVRGKSSSSDANAEYVAEVRNLFETNNIKYQFAELGRVDAGGGGTIAYILANRGIEVIDCGIGVLSMHSPYEVTSKFDIYTAYRAYNEFYKN